VENRIFFPSTGKSSISSVPFLCRKKGRGRGGGKRGDFPRFVFRLLFPPGRPFIVHVRKREGGGE